MAVSLCVKTYLENGFVAKNLNLPSRKFRYKTKPPSFKIKYVITENHENHVRSFTQILM